MQTAVTSFQKSTNNDIVNGENGGTKSTVDLHAQIHFGDASYYDYFNDDTTFGSKYDRVLYELVVEDQMLSPVSPSSRLQQLRPMTGNSSSTSQNMNPIVPTQSDRNTASQYGLQCQVDGIRYCKDGWVHADLTREEFVRLLSEHEQRQHQRPNSSKQPLWALASTSATYPGSELVTSLLRPLNANNPSASAALTRRLFTHLFLPGDALSGWIRAILWFGVPSPELSIMLVDWSSLSYVNRGSRRRRGFSKDNVDSNIGPISPIAAPVFLSLLTGNWGTARRLVFGQVLVAGQSNNDDTSKNGVLIDKRNERAIVTLREIEEENGNATKQNLALLYGAGHCRDLHRRMIEEGFVPFRTEWRTAFRAAAPAWDGYFKAQESQGPISELTEIGEGIIKSMSKSTLESVAVGLVILPLYLLIGGLDWVSTIADIGNALEGGLYIDGVAGVVLYLVRHVALYVAISKFVVDWGGNEGVFDEDDVMM